jgi:hypothetical protein
MIFDGVEPDGRESGQISIDFLMGAFWLGWAALLDD